MVKASLLLCPRHVFSVRFCSPYLLLAVSRKHGDFLALAYEIMILLNPPHYVVNLVRKTSALTFISDNNLDCFVNSSQIEFQGRIYCSNFSFFYNQKLSLVRPSCQTI